MGKKINNQIKAVILILFASVLWSSTMFRSGLGKSYGYGFWGPNGHDGLWHIALANKLSNLDFINPVFAGQNIKNYHIGFDLILGFIHKITGINLTTIYFQILPIVFAALIGFLVYKFVFLWRKSANEAFWATFFVYFSSSFGFIITLLRNGEINGESMFWSQQSFSTLINPPYALSLILILVGLIALYQKKVLLSMLLFGVLIQIKAYAAILVLGSLFIIGLYSFYTQRTTLYLRVFLGSMLMNLILFFSVKSDGLSAFSWQPFWFLETMMSYSDRLDWPRYYSAMTNYRAGEIWLKAILAYLIAFLIFVIGNMGLRVLGFYYYVKIVLGKIKIDWVVVFITTILGISVMIPLFFVQKGTPWNTIQFFYYYLFFFSILAGIVAAWHNKVLIIVYLSLAFLGGWATLKHYWPKMPQSMISTLEMDALEYLHNMPEGIVLTYPYDEIKAKEAINNPPRPLYLYESTAYVSAFSQKTVFLEDEVNLNITGYDWRKRREEVINWYKESDPIKAKKFLKDNNIKYIYWVKLIPSDTSQRSVVGDTELGLTKIFENDKSAIFSVESNN